MLHLTDPFVVVLTLAAALIGGCAQRPSLIPNSDPALNKKTAEFASDAINRHPMKTELPTAGRADGVAAIDYTAETLQLANLSSDGWENLEVWINGKYVVFVPRIEPGKLRTLNFTMFCDERGNPIPKASKNQTTPRIASVQVLRNDAWYDVPTKLAD